MLPSHFIVIAIIKHKVPVNTRNATLGYINMMYYDSDTAKARQGKGGERRSEIVCRVNYLRVKDTSTNLMVLAK